MALSATFEVASITKTFTATVVLLLAMNATLQLTDTLGEHLQDVLTAISAPIHFANVTIEQLLSHTGYAGYLVMCFFFLYFLHHPRITYYDVKEQDRESLAHSPVSIYLQWAA